MSFTESLTIRLLADSSDLDRGLEAAAKRLEELQARLARIGEVERQVGRIAGQFAGMFRPLETVSRLLDRIADQIRALARTPVTLNVAPALQALTQLGQTADLVAGKLRQLSVPAGPLPFPMPRSVRGFAEGGLVDGPAGIDRVPALLTTGEYVLRPPAVRQLGVEFLNAVNRQPAAAAQRPPVAPASAPATVNHFGGITVHVEQPAELHTLLRDLRLHGFRLGTRRG